MGRLSWGMFPPLFLCFFQQIQGLTPNFVKDGPPHELLSLPTVYTPHISTYYTKSNPTHCHVIPFPRIKLINTSPISQCIQNVHYAVKSKRSTSIVQSTRHST